MSSESLPTDNLIGQVLANRYQILHRLGEGAMGVVYKARHVKVGRSFAVKVLHARLLQDPKVALRFDREAELAGRLRHANVVGVVDVGELDGMRYMVMDFAEGPDLARLLVEAPMPAQRIIHLVRQMLEGLYHAHEQGLIHRDFKPENVIIERDTHGAEMPRIVDFGIAILRDGGETADGQGRLTTNGLVLGTPHYMAPEQAVADPIDHRIDLFALGIVVYEMLSGRLPFDGSGAVVARANLLVDPPAIVERVPYLEVDPLLEAFARRLMAKKRSARPATAKAARELLDLIDRDRPAAAAALGMPIAVSTSGPGATQSVPAQEHVSRSGGPPPAVTARLKPTPSQPLPSVRPQFRPAPPQFGSAPPPSEAPPRPPGSPPRPGQSPVGALPADPIAFSAPGQPRTPMASVDHETSIQTPLGWPPSLPSKHPRALLIAGAALGTAGIFAALMLARTSAKQDKPAHDNRVAMMSVGSGKANAGTNIGSAPGPAVTDTKATAPAPIASKTADVETDVDTDETHDPKASDPTEIKAPDTEATGIKLATKRVPPRDTKTHEPKTAGASATDIRAIDTKPAEAGTPKALPPEDVTANAVSALYYSVADQLKKLPEGDQSQKLWNRWRRYSVQTLMLAPQAERNAAAVELSKILKEARLPRGR